jgi:hypothetical protein
VTALRTYKDQFPISMGDIAWSESKKSVVTVTENNLGVSLDVTISVNGLPDGSVPITDLVFLRRGARV